MEDPFSLSHREKEVARLLGLGRSNHEIAKSLGIAERTVEFHLTHIYEKMGVCSRAEAIVKLRESTGEHVSNLGEFTVERNQQSSDNGIDRFLPAPADLSPAQPPAQLETSRKRSTGSWIRRLAVPLILGIITIVVGLTMQNSPAAWERLERECEHPGRSTVGQTIERSNASGEKVHGQFGTTGAAPWPAQPGYVVYEGIQTPYIERITLNLHYSKDSPATVPILVYLDDETTPRVSIVPIDQHSWDAFTWSGPVFLGTVDRGVHAIKFATQGQPYGVADLDKFELSNTAP